MGFEEINDQLTHPIACLDCHDQNHGAENLVRPCGALKSIGKDPDKATRQEMRSGLCSAMWSITCSETKN